MHTQAVCASEKMQYYKVFVLSFDSVFQMSLPNEGFPSFPACPSTPSPSFTHICIIMYQEVKKSGSGRKKTRSTLGTAEYGWERNTQCRGEWVLAQTSREQRLCWWSGVGGWRDPQVACGLGCSKVTLRSAEWEAASLPMTAWQTGVTQLRQWPKKEEPRLLWTFSQAEHQPGFLQTVRNLVFLKWSLCKWQNSFSLFMKTSPAIRCFL